MICILDMQLPPALPRGEPVFPGIQAIAGWIIATDIDDAREKAILAGHEQLAHLLYVIRLMKWSAGKHVLRDGRYIMLVS